jgi:hypothetical protein
MNVDACLRANTKIAWLHNDARGCDGDIREELAAGVTHVSLWRRVLLA